ncbi:MAG: Lrp/AsnC ligand binding domain-containing protein, partial [Candidatus Ranarchaeia archaeon]
VVLIDTELPVPIAGVSKELKRILKDVKNIDNVKDAYVVYGRFDYIVHLEAESYLEIVKTAARINALKNIRSTETLVEVTK